jgi:hypothetical protein
VSRVAINGAQGLLGMTHRTWLAGQALQGLLASGKYADKPATEVARLAWHMADAMTCVSGE